MMIENLQYILEHIVCAFDYWDFPTEGLCEVDGQTYTCQLINPLEKPIRYHLELIVLNDKQKEYIEDYKVAYPNWCYTNGKRGVSKHISTGWFFEKWGDYEPVKFKQD